MKLRHCSLLLISVILVSISLYGQSKDFESYSNYDFVAGDQILLYEDFADVNIGDFPVSWASNGRGEVQTVSIVEGKWLQMNAGNAAYCYTKPIEFPENFIIEFDIIPDDDYCDDLILKLYQDTDNEDLTGEIFPGKKGVYITIGHQAWETKAYDNANADADWIMGKGNKNPVENGKVNHLIICVENRRIRIYHKGEEIIDVNRNLHEGTKLNRFLFSGVGDAGLAYVSNIKITTAAPDTQKKLMTHGKVLTYGISFDTGNDGVKPESYGVLKEMASILSANPKLKIKIVGHTDSDGDAATNLDLSKRRAANIKTALVDNFQVDAKCIETDGKGETDPVLPNNSSQNKAKNRRIEFLQNASTSK